MKKFLSLLLAAMMLLALTPALAETAEATATKLLTSPDGSYSFEVPADYIPVNSETMLTLLNDAETQQMIIQMLGLENADQIWGFIEMIETNNLMVVYGPDMYSNLNTQAMPTSQTMEQVVETKEQMDQLVIQDYVSLGVPEAALQPMDIQKIGDRQWYAFGVDMGIMQLMQMMTVENGREYIFSFGGFDPQVITSILESFTIVAQ